MCVYTLTHFYICTESYYFFFFSAFVMQSQHLSLDCHCDNVTGWRGWTGEGGSEEEGGE